MRQSLIEHLRRKRPVLWQSWGTSGRRGLTADEANRVVDALVVWLRQQQEDYDAVAFMGSPGDIADLLSEET